MAAALSLQSSRRPNIVWIMADDMGWGDLGCYGQKQILTPNIDRLATQGMRFTSAYAGSAVCAPSRSTLMTGQHSGHTRVRWNHSVQTGGRVPLRPEDNTVAKVLRGAGYTTGIVGKWGLGEPDTTGVPNRQGFDDWYGFLNQDHAVDYYTDHLWRNEKKEPIPGNQNGAKGEYTTDLFTREALRFIRVNRWNPFFSHESGMNSEHKRPGYRAKMMARAVENQMFAVAANAPGNIAGNSGSHGQSRIIKDDGNIVEEASIYGEDVIVTTSRIRPVKLTRPLEAHRPRRSVSVVRVSPKKDSLAHGGSWDWSSCCETAGRNWNS